MSRAAIGAVAVLCCFAYAGLPPRPHLSTSLPQVPAGFESDMAPGVRPEARARVVWAGEPGRRTPCALVYIHGFSATAEEGNPLHREFARRYGCNLYLARLAGHGVESDQPLRDLTPEALVDSARRAAGIGRELGDRVYLMSTSTGGTLSLWLASGNPDLAGLILYSPNIRMSDPRTRIFALPWGLYVARLVADGDFVKQNLPEEVCGYWYCRYRLEALVALKSLVDATMQPATFRRVRPPVLLAYWQDDPVVSVPAMLEMFRQLGSAVKRKVEIPGAGDHCIASQVRAKNLGAVRAATWDFAEQTLGLRPQ